MELNSIRRCFITYRESDANTNSPTLYSNLHFNQRTRMGYDISRTKEEAHRGVSIHAPAWGATTFVALSGNPGLFQSTHPHGVRRCADSCQSRRRSFNPRTRMGCDIKHCLAMYRLYRFQSTHPHGVRLIIPPKYINRLVFQSTHPHGVRPQALRHETTTGCFNPRTRMGCDLRKAQALQKLKVSIHAPAWGATRCRGFSNLTFGVSIHAPAWGATHSPF